MRIFTVEASRETGEWMGAPVDMNESTTVDEWITRVDTDQYHYDTAEFGDPPNAETVAIVCKWID